MRLCFCLCLDFGWDIGLIAGRDLELEKELPGIFLCPFSLSTFQSAFFTPFRLINPPKLAVFTGMGPLVCAVQSARIIDALRFCCSTCSSRACLWSILKKFSSSEKHKLPLLSASISEKKMLAIFDQKTEPHLSKPLGKFLVRHLSVTIFVELIVEIPEWPPTIT